MSTSKLITRRTVVAGAIPAAVTALLVTPVAAVTTDPTISKVSASFVTHNDNKDHDTSVSIIMQNKKTMFLTQDIASLFNFAGNDEFGDNPPSTHTYDLTLASKEIKVSDLTVPIYQITIAPTGHDRWIFDITLTVYASDGARYSSTAKGIVLDQDNRTYTGVFNVS